MNNLLKILFFQIICLSNLAISAINVDNNLSATFSGIQAPRCSGDTGKFSFVIENGTPPYQFSIDNGQTYSLAYATDNLLENLNAGIYQVLVKDATETIVTVINPIDASDTIIFLDENSLTCEYCPSTATATVTEYIEEVSFHTINHISGNNLGYANFTNNPNISTTLSKGNTYTLTITPYHEYPSSNLPQLFWYVWIDYNGDYILSDDEAVVSGTGNLDDILVRNITIPSSAVSGTVMMRVQMKNFSENWGMIGPAVYEI